MEHSEQVGLRHRLQRIAGQIEHQHRQLQLLREGLRAAASPVPTPEATTACARYRDALLAHFELEERLFFPALHGLDGSSEPALIELQDGHRSFARELDALQARIAGEAGDDIASALAGLLARLDAHERREEALWPHR